MTDRRRVLALDPSTDGFYYAVLDGAPREEVRHIAHGAVRGLPTLSAWRREYVKLREFYCPTHRVVEVPTGGGAPFAARDVLTMSFGIGAVLSEDDGAYVVVAGPAKGGTGWRPALTGYTRKPPTGWAAEVKLQLAVAVTDWPARSNGHHREAGMVALAGVLCLGDPEREAKAGLRLGLPLVDKLTG